MTYRKYPLFLILLISIAWSPTQADTIFVDKDITSDSCTDYSEAERKCQRGDQRAFKTISDAAAVTLPGDVVEIRGGIYPVPADEEIRLTRSGDENAPITYRAYSSEQVVIKGPYDVDSDGDGVRDWDERASVNGDAIGPSSGDRGIGLAVYGNSIHVRGVRVAWVYKCVEVSGSDNWLDEIVVSDCWQGGISLDGGENNKVTSSAGFRIRHRSGGGLQNSDASSVTQGHVLYRNLFFKNGRQLPDDAIVAPINGDPAGGGNSDGWGASKTCSDDVGGEYSLCRDITFQENIAWRNTDDCYDTSVAGSWFIGNIGYDCGPRGNVGHKMLRNQFEMAFSGNLFIGANNRDSLDRGTGFRLADTDQSVTSSYVHHNMATGISRLFGIGVSSLSSPDRCQARNNLSWSNPEADDYRWRGCTHSNNYQGNSPGVANDGIDLAQSVASAESCLENAPHTVRVSSCWQALYDDFQNAYRPAQGASIVDAGSVIDGYHCPSADDEGQDPNVACRHWVGKAPDQGPFEQGINGNPDQTRCVEIGDVDRNGDGRIDEADACQASPAQTPAAPRNLSVIP